MTKSEFYAKLDEFLKLLEKERNDDVSTRHSILQTMALKEGRRGYHEIGYDEGLRFVKVWDQTAKDHSRSVAYFVEKETGVIFGSKGWKAYNPNHTYGDLDTIADWDWSGYYAVNKNGLKSLVPKSMRR